MAVYCTDEDLHARLSESGVDLRVDDAAGDLADVIDEASSIIDQHLYRHYDPAGFAGNRWVKHCCADVAAFLLCERRANPAPASIAEKFERRMKALEAVAAGKLVVPDLERRRADVPTLSNHRIKLGPVPHAVVERHRSPQRNRPQDYPQKVDYTEHPADYR